MSKSKVAESEVSLELSLSTDDLDYVPGDREPDLRERRSGVPGTVFNIINTIIGSGILGLPAAVAGIGWVSSSLFEAVGAGLYCTLKRLLVMAQVALRSWRCQLCHRMAERQVCATMLNGN